MPEPERRKTPDQLVAEILERDARYAPEAYAFVSEALAYTVEHAGRSGHVTGRELSEGLGAYALEQFGRLARTVLEAWGIRATADIGEIVFNMVEVGLLRKTDEDRRDDFADVYDFAEAFDRGFRIELVEGGEGDGA